MTFDKRWQLEIPESPGKTSLRIDDTTWLADWGDLHAAIEAGGWQTGDIWKSLEGLFRRVGKVVKL